MKKKITFIIIGFGLISVSVYKLMFLFEEMFEILDSGSKGVGIMPNTGINEYLAQILGVFWIGLIGFTICLINVLQLVQIKKRSSFIP